MGETRSSSCLPGEERTRSCVRVEQTAWCCAPCGVSLWASQVGIVTPHVTYGCMGSAISGAAGNSYKNQVEVAVMLNHRANSTLQIVLR